MTEEWTPRYRLETARQREHIVLAIARVQSEWREILEALERAESADDARKVLMATFGFTADQGRAVLDTQFRRVTRQDRDRISSELTALREEIAGLEGEL